MYLGLKKFNIKEWLGHCLINRNGSSGCGYIINVTAHGRYQDNHKTTDFSSTFDIVINKDGTGSVEGFTRSSAGNWPEDKYAGCFASIEDFTINSITKI